MSRNIVRANDGAFLYLEEMEQAIVYNGGVIDYVQVQDGDNVYRQTMTWTDGKLTGVSAWVRQ